MHNEFTAIIERDGAWYIAHALEIPGANGQGKTKQEALDSLTEAIGLILEDRRQEGLRGSKTVSNRPQMNTDMHRWEQNDPFHLC